MKSHFSIGILLLICAQCALFASIPIKRQLDQGKEQMVREVNQARVEAAKQINIANMHEMVYDKEYENIIHQATCEKPPSGSFMVIAVPSQQELNQLSEEQQKQVDQQLTNAATAFVHPDQYRIGCVDNPKPCLQGACLIGPKSSISWDSVKKGPPGSQCPNGKTDSGLCKVSIGKGLNFFTLILVIIASLNFI